MRPCRRGLPGCLFFLLVLLALELPVCLCIGRYPISPREAAGILAGQVLPLKPFWTEVQASLFLRHRLPRVLLACLVGSGLSAAGAAYQGVFRNPMAAPDLLGASSGAALGAALAILLRLGSTATVFMAFACSLATVLAVMYVGSRTRNAGAAGLVLAGILIGSLVSSGLSLIKLAADPEDQLPAITYWLMGSLNGTTPGDLLLAAVPMTLGLGVLLLLRWRINVLTLGDEEARALGVDPGRLRCLVILCATLVTAAAVAVSGVIGWVGLVVPHVSRRLTGSNYQRLLPVSMVSGAIFLLLSDTVARNLFAAEIPIGILTAFLGAPAFLLLLSKKEVSL